MESNYFAARATSEQAEAILLDVVHTVRAFRAAGQHRGRHAISGTTVGVLQCLAQQNSRTSEIARHLSLSVPVVSRAVETLERDGLVTREADEADGRAFLLSLTERGAEDLRTRHRYVAEQFATVLNEWSDTELAETRRALTRLTAGFEELAQALEAEERATAHA